MVGYAMKVEARDNGEIHFSDKLIETDGANDIEKMITGLLQTKVRENLGSWLRESAPDNVEVKVVGKHDQECFDDLASKVEHFVHEVKTKSFSVKELFSKSIAIAGELEAVTSLREKNVPEELIDGVQKRLAKLLATFCLSAQAFGNIELQ